MKTAIFALVATLAIAGSITSPAAQAADTTTARTPAIYDTLANTVAQIDSAIAQAHATNRHVLIQWGANWCVWCHLLHDKIMGDSVLFATMESNYVWVLADVGVKGKNADLLEQYGVDRDQGIPFLTLLDGDGKLLANQETGALETGDKKVKGHDREKVLAFLNSHAPEGQAAEAERH